MGDFSVKTEARTARRRLPNGWPLHAILYPFSRDPVYGLARVLLLTIASLMFPPAPECAGAGVTLITHGLNGNTGGWISGMADKIPQYPGFPQAGFTCYKLYFYPNSGRYYPAIVRESGESPLTAKSGEIIVKLDWSQLADGDSFNTREIAPVVATALLDKTFVPELGGRALAELPLHLIGHSRGGSLVSEIAKNLGTKGVWVDHVTTLDPHPLNDPEFPLDFIMYSAVDAPVRAYVNVLYHDNYHQKLDTFTVGQAVTGAFNRYLYNLSGGYSSSHSDVHLWYHGTIELGSPASDREASLGQYERSIWWNAPEANGTNAGFALSLIAGGDRFSTMTPVVGRDSILDGYNQIWPFGAGQSVNRTGLPSNSGAWPNLIQISLLTTNTLHQGQSVSLKYFYQWAQPESRAVAVAWYLDRDCNPRNGNERLMLSSLLPGTGADYVYAQSIGFKLNPASTPVGEYRVFGRIIGGGNTRYLYFPKPLHVLPPVTIALQPESSTVLLGSNANFRVIAQGAPVLRYQWKKNGVNIPGATRSTFSIPKTSSGSAGNYRVQVANAYGSALSSNAILTVLAPPRITIQPRSRSVVEGTNAAFRVAVAGTPPFQFQWLRDGTPLEGATNAVCAIAPVQAGDAGAYSVTIRNIAGEIQSSNALLKVNVRPVITLQPQTQTAEIGSAVAFRVEATGTTPIRYQWRKNGVSLLGATRDTLFVTNIKPTSAGLYSVVVANVAGKVGSDLARLTVVPQSLLTGSNTIASAGFSSERPVLKAGVQGSNFVLLWPTNPPGFALQSASSLSTGAVWVLGLAPSIVGTNYVVTELLTSSNRFYRLEPACGAAGFIRKDEK